MGGNQFPHFKVSDAIVESVERGVREIQARDLVARLWQKDPTLWKAEAEHQKVIANSLGWLTVADSMHGQVQDLLELASQVRTRRFEWVVLLGMGGSSLCPEVLRRSFGRVSGFPELIVLDSTIPAVISQVETRIDSTRTLFVVSSKSGTTIEPRVLFQYFFDRLKRRSGEHPGQHFVAITDPGTPLESDARANGFLRVFLNAADIGGRYSALSHFGLVPAVMAGYDVATLLDRAGDASSGCGPNMAVTRNPGAMLGALIGEMWRAGRDKLTLVLSPPIESLGLWIEQLIAESTGKEGRGLIPIADEPLGTSSRYGPDRLFVSAATEASLADATEAKLTALEAAGHPVVRITLRDALDLGAQFFVWEFATAVAGALIGIDPFDQPNVQESKDNTASLLSAFKQRGRLPDETPLARDGDVSVYAPSVGRGGSTVSEIIASQLKTLKWGNYAAVMAYIEENAEHNRLLTRIRVLIRDATRAATTTGYGPRFLHSTGQLHKGGPPKGVFIQITAGDATDLEIPGEPYTFGTLKRAQALGDLKSLVKRNLPVLRVHIHGDVTEGLAQVLRQIESALEGFE